MFTYFFRFLWHLGWLSFPTTAWPTRLVVRNLDSNHEFGQAIQLRCIDLAVRSLAKLVVDDFDFCCKSLLSFLLRLKAPRRSGHHHSAKRMAEGFGSSSIPGVAPGCCPVEPALPFCLGSALGRVATSELVRLMVGLILPHQQEYTHAAEDQHAGDDAHYQRRRLVEVPRSARPPSRRRRRLFLLVAGEGHRFVAGRAVDLLTGQFLRHSEMLRAIWAIDLVFSHKRFPVERIISNRVYKTSSRFFGMALGDAHAGFSAARSAGRRFPVPGCSCSLPS